MPQPLTEANRRKLLDLVDSGGLDQLLEAAELALFTQWRGTETTSEAATAWHEMQGIKRVRRVLVRMINDENERNDEDGENGD